jgi:outer membrane autotransporter protein
LTAAASLAVVSATAFVARECARVFAPDARAAAHYIIINADDFFFGTAATDFDGTAAAADSDIPATVKSAWVATDFPSALGNGSDVLDLYASPVINFWVAADDASLNTIPIWNNNATTLNFTGVLAGTGASTSTATEPTLTFNKSSLMVGYGTNGKTGIIDTKIVLTDIAAINVLGPSHDTNQARPGILVFGDRLEFENAAGSAFVPRLVVKDNVHGGGGGIFFNTTPSTNEKYLDLRAFGSVLFENNAATQVGGGGGGAIYLRKDAPSDGVGGVAGNSTILIGDDATFRRNTAVNVGGAIATGTRSGPSDAKLELGDNALFERNSASTAGAIEIITTRYADALFGDNARFIGNSATTGAGGAIFAWAYGDGGRVYYEFGEGAFFFGNSAALNGGAIASTSRATGTAAAHKFQFGDDATFAGNCVNAPALSASTPDYLVGGGAIYVASVTDAGGVPATSGSIEFRFEKRTVFSNNTVFTTGDAPAAGGAVFLHSVGATAPNGANLVFDEGTVFSGNSVTTGGDAKGGALAIVAGSTSFPGSGAHSTFFGATSFTNNTATGGTSASGGAIYLHFTEAAADKCLLLQAQSREGLYEPADIVFSGNDVLGAPDNARRGGAIFALSETDHDPVELMMYGPGTVFFGTAASTGTQDSVWGADNGRGIFFNMYDGGTTQFTGGYNEIESAKITMGTLRIAKNADGAAKIRFAENDPAATNRGLVLDGTAYSTVPILAGAGVLQSARFVFNGGSKIAPDGVTLSPGETLAGVIAANPAKKFGTLTLAVETAAGSVTFDNTTFDLDDAGTVTGTAPAAGDKIIIAAAAAGDAATVAFTGVNTLAIEAVVGTAPVVLIGPAAAAPRFIEFGDGVTASLGTAANYAVSNDALSGGTTRTATVTVDPAAGTVSYALNNASLVFRPYGSYTESLNNVWRDEASATGTGTLTGRATGWRDENNDEAFFLNGDSVTIAYPTYFPMTVAGDVAPASLTLGTTGDTFGGTYVFAGAGNITTGALTFAENADYRVATNGDLTVNGAVTLPAAGSVTLTVGGAGTGTLTLKSAAFTLGGDLTVNAARILLGGAGGTLDGAGHALVLNGDAQFTMDGGATWEPLNVTDAVFKNLSSLTLGNDASFVRVFSLDPSVAALSVAGFVVIEGDIATTGAQTYGRTSTSSSSTTLTAARFTFNSLYVDTPLTLRTNAGSGAAGSGLTPTLTTTPTTAATAAVLVAGALFVNAYMSLTLDGPLFATGDVAFDPFATLVIAAALPADGSAAPVITVSPATVGTITAAPEHVTTTAVAYDFLTVVTTLSADAKTLFAAETLAWNAPDPADAHGTFTLPAAGDAHTVALALTDNTAAAAAGFTWDGATLEKLGDGTLTLAPARDASGAPATANTYTGETRVLAGTLTAAGAFPAAAGARLPALGGTAAVLVAGGATLRVAPTTGTAVSVALPPLGAVAGDLAPENARVEIEADITLAAPATAFTGTAFAGTIVIGANRTLTVANAGAAAVAPVFDANGHPVKDAAALLASAAFDATAGGARIVLGEVAPDDPSTTADDAAYLTARSFDFGGAGGASVVFAATQVGVYRLLASTAASDWGALAAVNTAKPATLNAYFNLSDPTLALYQLVPAGTTSDDEFVWAGGDGAWDTVAPNWVDLNPSAATSGYTKQFVPGAASRVFFDSPATAGGAAPSVAIAAGGITAGAVSVQRSVTLTGGALAAQSVSVAANATADFANTTVALAGALDVAARGKARFAGALTAGGDSAVAGSVFSAGDQTYGAALTLGAGAEVGSAAGAVRVTGAATLGANALVSATAGIAFDGGATLGAGAVLAGDTTFGADAAFAGGNVITGSATFAAGSTVSLDASAAPRYTPDAVSAGAGVFGAGTLPLRVTGAADLGGATVALAALPAFDAADPALGETWFALASAGAGSDFGDTAGALFNGASVAALGVSRRTVEVVADGGNLLLHLGALRNIEVVWNAAGGTGGVTPFEDGDAVLFASAAGGVVELGGGARKFVSRLRFTGAGAWTFTGAGIRAAAGIGNADASLFTAALPEGALVLEEGFSGVVDFTGAAANDFASAAVLGGALRVSAPAQLGVESGVVTLGATASIEVRAAGGFVFANSVAAPAGGAAGTVSVDLVETVEGADGHGARAVNSFAFAAGKTLAAGATLALRNARFAIGEPANAAAVTGAKVVLEAGAVLEADGAGGLLVGALAARGGARIELSEVAPAATVITAAGGAAFSGTNWLTFSANRAGEYTLIAASAGSTAAWGDLQVQNTAFTRDWLHPLTGASVRYTVWFAPNEPAPAAASPAAALPAAALPAGQPVNTRLTWSGGASGVWGHVFVDGSGATGGWRGETGDWTHSATGALTTGGAWDGDEITFATAGAQISVAAAGVVVSGLNITADTAFSGGAIRAVAGTGNFGAADAGDAAGAANAGKITIGSGVTAAFNNAVSAAVLHLGGGIARLSQPARFGAVSGGGTLSLADVSGTVTTDALSGRHTVEVREAPVVTDAGFSALLLDTTGDADQGDESVAGTVLVHAGARDVVVPVAFIADDGAGRHGYGFDYAAVADAAGGAGKWDALNAAGNAIINSNAALAGAWFEGSRNLGDRFNALQFDFGRGAGGGTGAVPAATGASNVPWLNDGAGGGSDAAAKKSGGTGGGAGVAGAGEQNAFWLQGHYTQSRSGFGPQNRLGDFRDSGGGGDVGYDRLFGKDGGSVFWLGATVGYAHAERRFETFRGTAGGSGKLDAVGGAIYARFLHASGLFVNGAARVTGFTSEFKAGGDKGEFDTLGAGADLAAGWRFDFRDNWFVSPEAQFGYARLSGSDYATATGSRVSNRATDAFRYGALVRGGRAFFGGARATGGGWALIPEINLGIEGRSGGVETAVTSNSFTDCYASKTDLWQFAVGAGVTWQIGESASFRLDYAAAFGNRYEVPVRLNLAFRKRF